MWTQKGVGARIEAVGWEHTLNSFVNKAVTEGFTECFKISSRGLYAISKGRYFRPEQIQIIDICHFDQTQIEQSVMYILETFDGIKGTLVDGGTLAASFIAEAEAYQAKLNRYNKHHC